MCLFRKKKTKTEKVIENVKEITSLAKSMDVLFIRLGESEPEIVRLLRVLQDKVRYFNPTFGKVKIDDKIASKIGDIEIAITKAEISKNYDTVKRIINDLDIMITQRNA